MLQGPALMDCQHNEPSADMLKDVDVQLWVKGTKWIKAGVER